MAAAQAEIEEKIRALSKSTKDIKTPKHEIDLIKDR